MMEQDTRLMDVLIEQKIIVYRVAKDEEKKTHAYTGPWRVNRPGTEDS